MFIIGVALKEVGPATMWPWLVGGALQLLIAFCVAEACSSFPVAGGANNIVSRLGGRFLGWQTGWWLPSLDNRVRVDNDRILIDWQPTNLAPHRELVRRVRAQGRLPADLHGEDEAGAATPSGPAPSPKLEFTERPSTTADSPC